MSDHLSGFSGASGISYGLNIRGGAAKKKAPAAAAKPLPALAAFAVDSDDVRVFFPS